MITSARNNIFWSSKKHLLANTLLCQKQQEVRFRLLPSLRAPGALKKELMHIIPRYFKICRFFTALFRKTTACLPHCLKKLPHVYRTFPFLKNMRHRIILRKYRLCPVETVRRFSLKILSEHRSRLMSTLGRYESRHSSQTISNVRMNSPRTEYLFFCNPDQTIRCVPLQNHQVQWSQCANLITFSCV